MATIKMPYGKKYFELDLDDIMTVVKANPVHAMSVKPADAVREALDNPIDSPKLSGIVKAGEKICILVPDATRLWQSPHVSVPIVVAELNKAGIKDEDIVILSACGTHRRQTPEEHASIVGPEIAKRIKIVDHQCGEKENLAFMGTTSRGTPVEFNKTAVNADKIISLCGVVYHFLAGFGGGGKMLLPGIAGDATIQHNHKLALNPGFGEGNNPGVRAGNLAESNPFHMDIVEAASMLPPAFSLNVVVDDSFNIVKAFAGDWKKAHKEACGLVEKMDGVAIPEKSDFVIASAGGMPKDINLYQAVKLLSNAMAAAKPGGTVILLAGCGENFGNKDCEAMICDYADMKSREKALRNNFSIGSYAGFLVAEAGEQFKLLLVSDIPGEKFAHTNVHACSSLEEALALAHELNNGKLPSNAVVMPHGATTLPMPQK